MNNILYLALQSRSQIDQLKTSIVSLNYITDKDYRVFIYTNLDLKNEDFGDLKPNINIIIKSFECIEGNYIYKNKIKVLIDFIQEYNEKVIFVDNDTFYYKDPMELFERINKETVLMNYKETSVGEYYNLNLKIGKKHPFILKMYNMNKMLDDNIITPNTKLCNSGVVGIVPDHLSDLQKAIPLCEYISQEARIKTAEQIALSIVFQQKYKIEYADDKIFHYHFYKSTYLLLNHIFNIEKINLERCDKYLRIYMLKNKGRDILFENAIPIVIELARNMHKNAYSRLFYYISSESEMYKIMLRKYSEY